MVGMVTLIKITQRPEGHKGTPMLKIINKPAGVLYVYRTSKGVTYRKMSNMGELEIVTDGKMCYVSCIQQDRLDYGRPLTAAQAISVFNLTN